MKVKQSVCYVSLAIYSKKEFGEKVSEVLQISPSFVGERNGIYSWIWSTKDELQKGSVEDHFNLLENIFFTRTQKLIDLNSDNFDIRVWIYFGLNESNRSFVIDSKLLMWLSSFGSDVCVDAWS